MVNRDNFILLSNRYMESAEELYKAGKYEVAYYLAGYSVECLIKAVICTKIGPNEFPAKNADKTHYIHDIKKLVETAGLEKELEYDCKRNQGLEKSYMLLKDWDPKSLRYDSSRISEEIANNYFEAIKDKEGLVLWLNKYL